MKTTTIKRALYIVPVIIVFLSIFFPADQDNLFSGIYQVGDLFADIKRNREISQFPGALVVSYLISIFSGFFLATLGSRSPDFNKLVVLLNRTCGRLGGLFFSIGLAAPVAVLLFVDYHPGGDYFASQFFLAVSNNRFALAVWCCAVFILFFVSFQILIAAIVGLFKSGETK